MGGQRIGYVRVSGFDQNPERQLESTPIDRTFTDKASGKDVQRPQLEELMRFVRTGDTVVVHSMDRLARNLDDLRRIVQGERHARRGTHRAAHPAPLTPDSGRWKTPHFPVIIEKEAARNDSTSARLSAAGAQNPELS
jgi:DNA invertase Pin-like site-specific DNA recombinase